MAKTFRKLTILALVFTASWAQARPEPTGWIERAQSCMQALMDSFRIVQEQRLSARRVKDPDLRSFLSTKNWQLRLAQVEGSEFRGFRRLLEPQETQKPNRVHVLGFFTEGSSTSLEFHPDLGIYSSGLNLSLKAPAKSLVAFVESSEIFSPIRSSQLNLNTDFLRSHFKKLAEEYQSLNSDHAFDFQIHRFQDVVADGALRQHWVAVELRGVEDPKLRFHIELRLLSLIAEDLDFAQSELSSSHLPVTPL